MKNIGNILLLLIVSLLISASPLQIGQARACCLKHSNTCPMHQKKADRHCKENTHNEIQCCEDKCYPNLKYNLSEKPSNQIKSFQTVINITLSNFSNNFILNPLSELDCNFLEDFHRKKYSPPGLYLLKSSFLI